MEDPDRRIISQLRRKPIQSVSIRADRWRSNRIQSNPGDSQFDAFHYIAETILSDPLGSNSIRKKKKKKKKKKEYKEREREKGEQEIGSRK